MKRRRADEKAELFWRDASPITNMTWTSIGTTNCGLRRKVESTLRNFSNMLTSSAAVAEGGRSCKWCMRCVVD